MNPARARRWLERRGLRVRDCGVPGRAWVVAEKGHSEFGLNSIGGPVAPTADASLVALVEILRAPRREPNAGWKEGNPAEQWYLTIGEYVLHVRPTPHDRWVRWTVWDNYCGIANGESRTLRLAQLAAERAARRAARLRERAK